LNARLLRVLGGFFFFGQLHAPSVVADPKFRRHRLGFTLTNLAAFSEEFLNKGVIGGGFWDLFHHCDLPWLHVALEIGFTGNLTMFEGIGKGDWRVAGNLRGRQPL